MLVSTKPINLLILMSSYKVISSVLVTAFDYTGSLMVSHGHRTRTLSDAEDGTRIWHLVSVREVIVYFYNDFL